MPEIKRYYAHGKLLITGEYAVLDGALALAIPCKLGQWLEVETIKNKQNFVWESLNEKGGIWFSVQFDAQLTILQSTDKQIAIKLQKILKSVTAANSTFSEKRRGKKATSKLEFNRDWGLGSSSTLIHLISQWAKVNPYHLLENTFGGSGYDIACADANSPILYQVGNPPRIEPVIFNPSWADKMHFVFLGEKQVSSQEISKYADLEFDREKLVSSISDLTHQLLSAKDMDQFTTLLEKHETLLSNTLGYPTIKSQRFLEIKGTFKSLGAWGGDFVLFVGDKSELEKINQLGYHTIIGWEEMLIPLD